MADVKQILVVDDHFEMLESLRTILEMSNQEHQVLGVPSAEEGFLELRRTPFDLVITDVRLPGMSGFELVRRVQTVRPETPIIMITAYSSTQGKEEAEALGVYRYFQKPLQTDVLLAAVDSALYGEKAVREKSDVVSPSGAAQDVRAVDVDNQVRSRLQSLRTDTGAAQVVLANAQGDILFTIGPADSLPLPRLAQIMGRTLENSLRLADQLQSDDPLMIQYQSGQRMDLYSANIERAYFIMLFFEAHARRGRIGTIWIFAQRAVKDLKGLLLASDGQRGPEKRHPELMVPPSEPALAVGSEPAEAKSETAGPGQPEAAKEAGSVEVPANPVLAEEGTERTPEASTAEELLAELESSELALLLDNGDVGEGEVDLDAFWEAALTEEGESAIGGLSLEEAREQGLIPPEFRDDQ